MIRQRAAAVPAVSKAARAWQFALNHRWFLPSWLVIVAAYQINLGHAPLWGDEADTAVFARSVLVNGLPHAVIHGNAVASCNCYQLSASLLPRQLPWLQYYVAACSILVFGDDVTGVRRGFAILAALSAMPLYLVLRRHTASAAIVTTAAMLHPQTFLFARQARYYPLLICFTLSWLWATLEGPRPRWAKILLLSVIACLLFHAHPLAACGLCVVFLFRKWSILAVRRDDVAVASFLGFVSWAAWYLSMQPASDESRSSFGVLIRDPSSWFALVGRGLRAGIADLDTIGVMPLLAWSVVVLVAYALKRHVGLFIGEKSQFALLLLCIAGGATVVNAVVVGVEGAESWSVLRYAPHASLLVVIPLYLLLERLVGSGRTAAGIWLMILACNLGGLTYWVALYPRPAQPISWWPCTYLEVLGLKGSDYDAMEAAIRDRMLPGETLVVVPRWWSEVWVYRVGDHVRIKPDLDPRSKCAELIREDLGQEEFARQMRPSHAVRHGPFDARLARSALAVVHAVRPSDDGSRPELTRHEFPGVSTGKASVMLFKLR